LKTNIISTVCFVAFVVCGLLVAAGGGLLLTEPARRQLTNAFLLLVLGVSFAAGLTQHNLWPFSSWPVLAYAVPTGGRYPPLPRIVGFDASGKEYDIDYRAWQPLSLEELLSWVRLSFAGLDPAARDRVGRYLLERSNRAREQALSPAGLTFANRWLGPLTAPTHMLHPAIWSHPESVPHNSFIGLRIYDESWDLEERSRDPQKVTRVLTYEYRR
jgi:hypothetical protein